MRVQLSFLDIAIEEELLLDNDSSGGARHRISP
jgi:hypothetical protein